MERELPTQLERPEITLIKRAAKIVGFGTTAVTSLTLFYAISLLENLYETNPTVAIADLYLYQIITAALIYISFFASYHAMRENRHTIFYGILEVVSFAMGCFTLLKFGECQKLLDHGIRRIDRAYLDENNIHLNLAENLMMAIPFTSYACHKSMNLLKKELLGSNA